MNTDTTVENVRYLTRINYIILGWKALKDITYKVVIKKSDDPDDKWTECFKGECSTLRETYGKCSCLWDSTEYKIRILSVQGGSEKIERTIYAKTVSFIFYALLI